MSLASAAVRHLARLVLPLAALACSSTSDPFTSGPGHASVQGQVMDSGGAPRTDVPVGIQCPGAARVLATTDSQGRFVVNLVISERAFDAGAGQVACRFTEPASGPALVQVDTVLGFAQGPVLVALQFVDLHEP